MLNIIKYELTKTFECVLKTLLETDKKIIIFNFFNQL